MAHAQFAGAAARSSLPEGLRGFQMDRVRALTKSAALASKGPVRAPFSLSFFFSLSLSLISIVC